MRSNDGTPAFRGDVRVRHVGVVANGFDVGNNVARINFHGVVHGAFVVGARAVVVDPEPAADIDISHREAHFVELAVKAGGFGNGFLDS